MKHYLRLFFVAMILLLIAPSVSAQYQRKPDPSIFGKGSRRGGGSFFGKEATSQASTQSSPQRTSSSSSTSRQDNDTEGQGAKDENKVRKSNLRKLDARQTTTRIYPEVTRKWGQFVGVGSPLTKQQANQRNCSYYLTISPQGLCLQMETRDGYGNLTSNHNISAYLLRNSRDDYRVNDEYADQMEEVCTWRFEYDSQKRLKREEGYDAAGVLVYIMNLIQKEDKAYGSYINSYGEPMPLRADTLQSPPTTFCITYDNQGYESRLEQFDNKGYPSMNLDGAYSSLLSHDSQGRKISEASCDLFGQRTIDEYGNCGYSIQYSDDGRKHTSTYRDANWDIMIMPDSVSSDQNGTAIVEQDYDTYGRLTMVRYFDADAHAINNHSGFHSTEYTYNDHGLVTWIFYRDVYGNLFSRDSSAVAKVHYEFDRKGRQVLYENFNAYNELVDGSGLYARKTFSYEGDIMTSERRWWQLRGDIVQTYDDTIRVDKQTGHQIGVRSYPWDPDVVIKHNNDNKGRQILWEYCDTLGNPIIYSNKTYSTNITTYEDLPHHKQRIIDVYRTPDGHLAMNDDSSESYAIRHTLIDSVAQTIQYKDYNEDSVVVRNYVKHYTGPDLALMDYYTSLNPYDEPSRWGNKGENYITQKVVRNHKGEIVAYVGFNEFDEPAYIESNVGAYHSYVKKDGDYTLLDDSGKFLQSNIKFRKPYAMSIICLNEQGRQWGLRDGDYVFAFGTWDWRTESPSDAQDELWRESMRLVHSTKTIYAIRFQKEGGALTSKLVTVELPQGTMAELGLFFQRFILSPTELNRFQLAMAQTDVHVEESGKENAELILQRQPSCYGKFSPMFAQNWPEMLRSAYVPLVLYGVETNEEGERFARARWTFGDNVSDFNELANKYDESNSLLFATSDLQTCNSQPIDTLLAGMSMYSYVSEEESDRLREMADSLKAIYDVAYHLDEQLRLDSIVYVLTTWLQPDREQGDLTPAELMDAFYAEENTFRVSTEKVETYLHVLPSTNEDALFYSYNDDDNGPSDALKRLMMRVNLTNFELVAKRNPRPNVHLQVWVNKKRENVRELLMARQVDQSYDLYYLPNGLPYEELEEIIRQLTDD